MLQLYDPPASPDSKTAFIRALTDIEFIGAARFFAEQMSHVTKNTYLYEVAWTYPGEAGRQLGASHGIELSLLFDGPNAARGVAGDALAAAIRAYWTTFAATGNPNAPGLPNWPAYTSASPGYLTIAAPPRVGTDLKPQAFAIAKKLFSN